ncbi:glycosyltransferase family 4 protein [Mucisphaera sp.]|uniref:glycosyltransferase family 4 protein n=1 Tax=Mucisphaera sp. TaxID=2913024 RepID=UPI003D130483
MPSTTSPSRHKPKPVIGFDARNLTRASLRGIGVSTARLYARLAHLRPDWRFIAYHQLPRAEGPERLEAPNIEWKRIDVPGDRVDAWTQIRLPWQALRDKIDLLHMPANWCPIWQPVPTAVTLHDAIPLENRDRNDRQQRTRFQLALKAAAKAAAILTPSVYVASVLQQKLPTAAKRIHVIHWGADPVPGIDPEHTTLRIEPTGINQPFVLHFAAQDPRKNTRRLLDAWSLLPPDIRSTWKLVLVGANGSLHNDLTRAVNRLGVTASVTLLEPQDRPRLEALIREAGLLAYPSLSEGFGLPITEAFTRGTPVLTSNRTSMPEIAGNAAELVDPRNTMAIRNGLETLLTNPDRRHQLAEAGKQRAQHFRWDDAALRLAAVFENRLALPTIHLKAAA